MRDPSLEPRPASWSRTEMTEVVMPQHANTHGTVFGGVAMGWIDICGAIVAKRHSGHVCVTAFVDDLEFIEPVRVGDLVRLIGRITAAFTSSMEVEVVVEREETGALRRTRCVEALLVFVNVGPDGRPLPVPPVRLETDDDQIGRAHV